MTSDEKRREARNSGSSPLRISGRMGRNMLVAVARQGDARRTPRRRIRMESTAQTLLRVGNVILPALLRGILILRQGVRRASPFRATAVMDETARSDSLTVARGYQMAVSPSRNGPRPNRVRHSVCSSRLSTYWNGFRAGSRAGGSSAERVVETGTIRTAQRRARRSSIDRPPSRLRVVFFQLLDVSQ